MQRKAFIGAMFAVSVIATAASAFAGGFGLNALNGPWEIRVAGFEVNQDFLDHGNFAMTGRIVFNGAGGINAVDLNFNSGDASTFKGDCDHHTSFNPAGSGVAIKDAANGIAEVTLAFGSGDGCLPNDTFVFEVALSRTLTPPGGVDEVSSSAFNTLSGGACTGSGTIENEFQYEGQCYVALVMDGEMLPQ